MREGALCEARTASRRSKLTRARRGFTCSTPPPDTALHLALQTAACTSPLTAARAVPPKAGSARTRLLSLRTAVADPFAHDDAAAASKGDTGKANKPELAVAVAAAGGVGTGIGVESHASGVCVPSWRTCGRP